MCQNSESSRRDRNVAKLMFIQMMGYSTSFGQMECFKLISSRNYSEKRVGYLALSQLMDETSEVLMLGTQTIKNDLVDSNNLVSSLALTALANVANEEMCIAVAKDITSLLPRGAYIRRKVAAVMLRCCRKCPDLFENFIPHLSSLIEDKNHGVALAGYNLAFCMIELNHERVFKEIKSCLPTLTRRLKDMSLSGAGSNGEYDIYSITDPFLQTKIIRMIRLVCANDKEATESVSDVLAQVATNTDGSKNTGNAILLEVASCIAALRHAEPALVVLASNILGKFLANSRDPNMRFVGMEALQTLLMTGNLTAEGLADIQKKRPLVFQCLKEPDPAVRSCALEVACLLVNASNAKASIRELLNFLLDAEESFKPSLVSKIWQATIGFSNDLKWTVDTLVKVMCLAGNACSEADVDALLAIIVSSTPDNQAYSAFRLFFAAKENLYQEALIHSAIWTVGEFSDLLTSAQAQAASGQSVSVTGADVISLLQAIESRNKNSSHVPKTFSSLVSHIHQVGDLVDCTADAGAVLYRDIAAHLRTRLFLVNAWAKLSVRLKGSETTCIAGIRRYSEDPHIEVQQRAVELNALLTNASCSSKASEFLERIPPVDPSMLDARKKLALGLTGHLPIESSGAHGGANLIQTGVKNAQGAAKIKKNFFDSDDEAETATTTKKQQPNGTAAPSSANLLSDIFGSAGGSSAGGAAPPVVAKQPQAGAGANLLDDLLGLGNGNATTLAPANTASNDLLDIFGISSSKPAQPSATGSTNNDLLSLLGAAPSSAPIGNQAILGDIFGSSAPATNTNPYASFEVYNKNGLHITFYPISPDIGAPLLKNGGELKIRAEMVNHDATTAISGLNLEIAPPKYLNVRLETASGSQLPTNGGKVSQMVLVRKLADYSGSITLKCRVSYTKGGQYTQELADANKFSPAL